MENNETFKMTYSAQEQEEIDRIRKKYLPQEQDKMAELRKLDHSVTQKATTVAVTVGVIGALVMGIGMSMAMTDLAAALGLIGFYFGIGIGVVGIALVALAYPLYRRTLKKQREKIAPQILRLTDELQR